MIVYDRVTEIISCFTGIDKVPPQILKEAAHRGTVVHQMVEGYLKGIGHPEIPEAYQAYYNAFEPWIKDNPISVDWMERRFFCDDLMITGQMDIFTQDRRLIDIKTGSSMQKSWPVQLAGYKYLLERNGIVPASFHILWLNGKDCKYITYTIDDKYEDLFMSCYDIYNFFYSAKKKW